jgi:hypothetical protein
MIHAIKNKGIEDRIIVCQKIRPIPGVTNCMFRFIKYWFSLLFDDIYNVLGYVKGEAKRAFGIGVVSTCGFML